MSRRLPLLLAVIASALALCAPPGQARGLIAPASVCPDVGDGYGVAQDPRETVACMTDFARREAGLRPLVVSNELKRSAAAKSGDILRCDSFSHFACGRDSMYRIRLSAHLPTPCWRAAENLAWGAGRAGAARSIFRAWMASPSHRHNILGRYSRHGIGLKKGRLAGHGGAQVWTQHFVSPCR